MTVTHTLLTEGNDESNGTSYDTASISPSANKLLIVDVAADSASDGANGQPTLSGCGVTWVVVQSLVGVGVDGGGWARQTQFRAMGNPTTGVLTIDFGSDTQEAVRWSVCEKGNVDTGGTNGSAAVVQSATGTSTGTTCTVTLAAFGNINNATHGAFHREGEVTGATQTAGSGFTEETDLESDLTGGYYGYLHTEYRNDNDTTVDSTASDAMDGTTGIAIEIKESSAGVIYERTLSDNTSVNDQQQAYEDKLRILISNVDINDSLIRTLQLASEIIVRTLSSGITVSDLSGTDKRLSRLIFSNIDIEDLVGTVKILSRLVFDNVNVNDAIQRIVATIFERVLSSNINVNDSISTQKHIERLLVDTIVIADNVLQDKNLCRLLADNVVLTDAIIASIISASVTYNRILSDSVEVQDAVIREITALVRGYILMTIKESAIEIGTSESAIKEGIVESNIEMGISKSKGNALSYIQNLNIYSEQMDNAIYIKNGTFVTADDTTAPDGTLSADKVIVTNGRNNAIIYQIYNSLTIGKEYKLSYHIKQAELRYVFIWFVDSFVRGFVIEVDLQLGTGRITYDTGEYPVIFSIEEDEEGFYRITTQGYVVSTTTLIPRIYVSDTPYTDEDQGTHKGYIGDGITGFHLWGVQFNDNVDVHAYSKTESSVVDLSLDSSTENKPVVGTAESNIEIDTRN